MEARRKLDRIKKRGSVNDASVLKESNPSVTVLLIDNKKNGKKYIIETVSDAEIMRRRNPAYKFLM
ncbi:MAG: hypothetical protein V4722_24180 [Bacteroidota bacterium]